MPICLADGLRLCLLCDFSLSVLCQWSPWDNPDCSFSCVYIAVFHIYQWQHSCFRLCGRAFFIPPVMCITVTCQHNSISCLKMWHARNVLKLSWWFCLCRTARYLSLCDAEQEPCTVHIWLAESQSMLTLWSLCCWLINQTTVISSKLRTLTDTNYHEASLARLRMSMSWE